MNTVERVIVGFTLLGVLLIVSLWKTAVLEQKAQASVNPAPQINSSRLGDFDCGLTIISGRSCVYCMPGNRVNPPSISCDFR